MFKIVNNAQHPQFEREASEEAEDKIAEQMMLNDGKIDPEDARLNAEDLLKKAEAKSGQTVEASGVEVTLLK